MKKSVFVVVVSVCTVICMTLVERSAFSDDASKQKPAATIAAEEDESHLGGAQPTDLSDPGFGRFVDISLVGEAWESLDAALLLDSALQLAEGERVLMRPHKVIAADDLLRVVVKVAVEKKDKTTLDRLANAVVSRPNSALKAQVETAQKLLDVSRAGDSPLMVPVTDTSLEQFLFYHRMSGDLQAARIRGDRPLVEKLEEFIKRCEGLPSHHRDYLLKVTSESRSASEKPAENEVANDVVIATLDKLATASRDSRESEREREARREREREYERRANSTDAGRFIQDTVIKRMEESQKRDWNVGPTRVDGKWGIEFNKKLGGPSRSWVTDWLNKGGHEANKIVYGNKRTIRIFNPTTQAVIYSLDDGAPQIIDGQRVTTWTVYGMPTIKYNIGYANAYRYHTLSEGDYEFGWNNGSLCLYRR